MTPQPLLAQWHADRLKHPVLLLDADQRVAVNGEVARLCGYRQWKLWSVNARTNHVHCVVTAANTSGRKVRDQLKANCTRVLRERWPVFIDRPVWTVGGDWQSINSEEDLEQVIIYVSEAQDRKDRDLC